jgi:hypothetical protein
VTHFKRLMIACAIMLRCATASQAQENSVGVTPASIDAKVTPGASYTQTFTVFNNTGTRLRFECSVEDMWYDEANQRVAGRGGTLPHSASLWVLFSPTEVVVDPHSSSVVMATVSVPRTAAGGYYAVPVFKSLPAKGALASLSGDGDVATASIGVRFLLLMMFTTREATEYAVEIKGGRITPPTASAELSMELDVVNRSTAHVNLRGAFAILSSTGVMVGRGDIPAKRYLPSQRNVIQAEWTGDLPPGAYTSVITLTYDRIGKSPATLVYELPFIVR